MIVADEGPVRNALIAYGSETGNAHNYAEELGRLLERIHFDTHVSKLDAVDIFSLEAYCVVIIVISTTGQGDLPANARSFWKSLLRKKLPSDCLHNVQMTTFGLGDTSYPKYNWAARKLHKRLLQLGATEIYPRSEADEQHDEGLDASFVPWSTDFQSHLLSRFPLEEGLSPIPEKTLLQPKWLLALETGPTEDSLSFDQSDRHTNGERASDRPGNINDKPEFDQIVSRSPVNDSDRRLTVEVQENRRVTPETHWQDVRHLAFSSQIPAPYSPGDVLTIYPQNSPGSVDEIITMMDWTDVADASIKFVPNKSQRSTVKYSSPPLSLSNDSPTTLRHLLINHLDVTAIPRRSFFSYIAHFTTDEFHKDRLLEFTDPKYVDELYDYTTRPRRSILEVLQEFESVKIPWQWAANVLPELRGRQFSIASGGIFKTNSNGSARFELLVAIVKYKTVIKKIREGVCTRYLAGLRPGDQLALSLQRGGLGFSKADMERSIIMVGPGTGVAPMRSLIWERLQMYEMYNSQREASGSEEPTAQIRTPGETCLFFGCRNQNADFFFEDEWNSLKAHEHAPAVYTAFSRDQTQKRYVQDVIREQASKVWSLLHHGNAIVCVCGSSGKMPTAVRAALVDVIRRESSEIGSGSNGAHTTEEAAVKYLEAIEKAGRYKQETW